MSYSSEILNYGKEHLYIVEIDVDYCQLTFGVLPCTASGSGDSKCYNTLASTQAPLAYDPAPKTYRFCEARSPHPIGLDAIPSLKSVGIAPAQIDLSGGLGVRASVDLVFNDHPHSDIDIDKYVDERTYIASDRGTFWTKFRARNPNYQFREVRVLSGYLVNGKFDSNNFTTRYYVIEKLDVSNGVATLVGKDPLKLTSEKKAQAPAPSTGQLSADLALASTSATLTPSGVGNLEYPTSGKILIRSEVMAFTRSNDVLTLTRAQNNTLAADHASGDTVQLCLEYAGKQVNFIVNDLLSSYANINPSFIPLSAWQSEVDTYISGLISGIIVKPFDVFKLLKELAQSMPHYLWWDERQQVIQLTALKSPPINADVLDMDENLVSDMLKTVDKPDLRKSTVFVNFGQFDPTKNLDEIGNYQQTYARIDTDSISKYGSNEITTINSRWISNTNKAAALQLAALLGRRFSDIPREITFHLEAKDSAVWVGQSRSVNHRDITDFSGLPMDTVFQIMSAKEDRNFEYKGLEFTYGGALPGDEGGGDPAVDLVIFGSDQTNTNLRTVYDSLFPAPDSLTKVKFIIEGGVKLGSTITSTYGMDTGSWPAGATITLQVDSSGFAVGKGGDEESDGGGALILNHDLEIINNGVIGGGGGGGEKTSDANGTAGGGGGAGYISGSGGLSFNTSGGISINAGDGTLQIGGAGGFSGVLEGGNGGLLGQDGNQATPIGSGVGLAGVAINKNGFTLTQTVSGDIRGFIIN